MLKNIEDNEYYKFFLEIFESTDYSLSKKERLNQTHQKFIQEQKRLNQIPDGTFNSKTCKFYYLLGYFCCYIEMKQELKFQENLEQFIVTLENVY